MQTAPHLQHVPLDHLHRSLGARMVPFAGYDMPVNYAKGIINEHLHTRSQASLFDVSHMGCIFLHGPEVDNQLEKLLPVDIQEMAVGQIKYSLLMNPKGGIEDDLLISRLPKGFMLVVNANRKHHDLSYVQSKLSSNIVCEPQFEKAMFALQGPKANDVMKRLCPGAITLKFMTLTETSLQGHPALISRTGYTGEDGFEIICAPNTAKDIFEHLLEQPEVELAGLGARDSLRLEAGLCLYGHELDDTISPVEAGLTWAIGKRRRIEGKFAGATRVLTEIQDRPNKCRIGIIPDCKAIPREGSTLHDTTGQQVGVITSGSQSPSLGHPIAMGYIDKRFTDAPLQVKIRGQLYSARKTKLPFIPPNYQRD